MRRQRFLFFSFSELTAISANLIKISIVGTIRDNVYATYFLRLYMLYHHYIIIKDCISIIINARSFFYEESSAYMSDDRTNLVFQHTDVELDVEFRNVKAWAATNCLKLNLSKTKEIVFKRPRAQYFHMPPPLVDIEQLDCCKLLGVIF